MYLKVLVVPQIKKTHFQLRIILDIVYIDTACPSIKNKMKMTVIMSLRDTQLKFWNILPLLHSIFGGHTEYCSEFTLGSVIRDHCGTGDHI